VQLLLAVMVVVVVGIVLLSLFGVRPDAQA
jgi:hypothetical protein